VTNKISAEAPRVARPQAPSLAAEAIQPERAASKIATFEVLHENIEIEPRVLMNPAAVAAHTQAPAYSGGTCGSVARLSNGLLVSRTETRAGSGAFRYAVFGPNPDGVAFDAPRDWPEFFRGTLEKWEIGPGTHTIGPRDKSDAERFANDYPDVAIQLGIKPQRIPKAIFPVGQARKPKNLWHHINFPELVERHAGGDFGAVGVYSDEPLTVEQVWAIGIQPLEIQNRQAIRTGRGAVFSRFPFSAQPWRPGEPDLARVCMVSTLLGPGKAVTLVDVD
jgi:hypothetical protein